MSMGSLANFELTELGKPQKNFFLMAASLMPYKPPLEPNGSQNFLFQVLKKNIFPDTLPLPLMAWPLKRELGLHR